MGQPYNRISENVLFALLLAALIGWFTAPVAADLQSASVARACFAVGAQTARS
jgi:hypothetical protein